MFTHLIKKPVLLVSCALAAVFVVFPHTASAATGPWQWVDSSAKLSTRRDRPVWAIARGENYWYLTDGKDLYAGGHVWRTEGSIMTDVTTEVRAAGVHRVDDMVSDGRTVLFLNNVMAANASIELVAHREVFTNQTQTLRHALMPNEGIASVSGKDGTFLFVTTSGRLLEWTADSDIVNRLPDAPGTAPYHMVYTNVLRYSVRKTSPRDSTFQLAAVPLARGWLVVVHEPSAAQRELIKVFRYENSSYEDITPLFSTQGLTRVSALASNGKTAFMAASDRTTGRVNRVYTYDGVDLFDITATTKLPPFDWTKALVTHNGRSWMLVSGKDLMRFDGKTFESLGKTRDYFVTLAGDSHGTVLLGGAVSKPGQHNGPTQPLTAKLVKVTEPVSSQIASTPTQTQQSILPSDGTKKNSSMSSFWTWVEPNTTTVLRDQTIIYRVGAWNQQGIKSIEIFINGSVALICQFGSGALGNQACAVDISGKDYSPYTEVVVNAKIIDVNDAVVWTPTRTVSVMLNTSEDVVTWTWLEPNVATLNWTDAAVVKAQARARDGLNRIEFYVNGSMRQMCDFARAYGLRDCELRLSGIDYAPGTALQIATKAVGQDGVTALSHTRILEVRDNTKDAGPRPTTLTIGISPNKNLLHDDESVVYMAQAQDADGLDRIEIFVDGALAHVCGLFDNAYNARDCSLPINPTQYPDRYILTVAARAIDTKGYITWSNARSFSFTHSKRI